MPENWPRWTAIDAHGAGEPLRVLTGGYPHLPGDPLSDGALLR